MTFEKLKTLDLFRRIPDEGMMIAVLEGRILVERYRKEEYFDLDKGYFEK